MSAEPDHSNTTRESQQNQPKESRSLSEGTYGRSLSAQSMRESRGIQGYSRALANNPVGIPMQLSTAQASGSLSNQGTQTAGDGLSQMENAFGIKPTIHTNSAKATGMNALAYAQGNDIHFAPGQFNPSTQSGRELIGHEMAHVVQQAQGRVTATTQKKGVAINDDSSLEKEADEMGKRAARGEQVYGGDAETPSSNTNAPVQRFEAPLHEAAGRNALEGMSTEEASAAYFGNWMRDVNQALVPMAIDMIGADATYSLLSYLALKKFGFSPSPEQLGYYIPAEHIDSPAGQIKGMDYAESRPEVSEDVVNEASEFFLPGSDNKKTSTRHQTPQASTAPSATFKGKNIFDSDQEGVMVYMRRTNEHIEKRLTSAALKGRNSHGLMDFGAAMHAVEDLFAHSNFVEIAINDLLKNESDIMGAESNLVPELKGDERHVQAFAPTVTINDEKREVLTTGTFLGSDTQVSIGHEINKFLHEGLGEVSTAEMDDLQRKFISGLVSIVDRKQDSGDFGDFILKQIKDEDGNQIINNPGARMLFNNIPIKKLHDSSVMFANLLEKIGVADAKRKIDVAIKKFLKENVVVPAAAHLEANALELQVKDTAMREQRKNYQATIDSGGKTPINQGVGMVGQEETSASLQRMNLLEAKLRKATTDQLPAAVVAGASHSQLSKDHTNSLFFGLSFQLAVEANKRIKEKMVTYWGARKSRNEAPHVKDDALKAERLTKAEESQQEGDSILEKGYAKGHNPSLHDALTYSADMASDMAQALYLINSSPDKAEEALNTLREYQTQNEKKGNLELFINKSQTVIDGARAKTSQHKLKDIGDKLSTIATCITETSNLHQREAVYNDLTAERNKIVAYVQNAIASGEISGSSDITAYSGIITVMDRLVASCAPSYTEAQRDALEGAPELHVSVVKRGYEGLLNGSAAPSPQLKAVLDESRFIFNHPMENRSFWKDIVANYIRNNKQNFIDTVRARNYGIAHFKGDHH